MSLMLDIPTMWTATPIVLVSNMRSDAESSFASAFVDIVLP